MSEYRKQEGAIVFGDEFRVTVEVADLNEYMKDPRLIGFLDFAGQNLADIFNKRVMQLRLRDPVAEGFVYGPKD
ncbi:MAG: hypothetical protein NE328_00310 [Lentisphaeraceae bacterium]|nr:hypothetical protein [Lentisphaeraceae bacterium]